MAPYEDDPQRGRAEAAGRRRAAPPPGRGGGSVSGRWVVFLSGLRPDAGSAQVQHAFVRAGVAVKPVVFYCMAAFPGVCSWRGHSVYNESGTLIWLLHSGVARSAVAPPVA